jgi:magnesium chelatase family protein
VARYQGKISGPLLDRIDLQVEVAALPPDELVQAGRGEPSGVIAARVQAARQIAQERQGASNAALSGQALDEHCALHEGARPLLTQVATRLGWSGRSLHRCLKVARTIADLAGSAQIQPPHLAEAIQYRRGLKVG